MTAQTFMTIATRNRLNGRSIMNCHSRRAAVNISSC